jgi:hypothetical protein
MRMRVCALVRGINALVRQGTAGEAKDLETYPQTGASCPPRVRDTSRTAVASFPIGKQSVVGDFAPKREGISTPPFCGGRLGALGPGVPLVQVPGRRLADVVQAGWCPRSIGKYPAEHGWVGEPWLRSEGHIKHRI